MCSTYGVLIWTALPNTGIALLGASRSRRATTPSPILPDHTESRRSPGGFFLGVATAIWVRATLVPPSRKNIAPGVTHLSYRPRVECSVTIRHHRLGRILRRRWLRDRSCSRPARRPRSTGHAGLVFLHIVGAIVRRRGRGAHVPSTCVRRAKLPLRRVTLRQSMCLALRPMEALSGVGYSETCPPSYPTSPPPCSASFCLSPLPGMRWCVCSCRQ